MLLGVIPSSLQLVLYVEEGHETGFRLKTGFITKAKRCYILRVTYYVRE